MFHDVPLPGLEKLATNPRGRVPITARARRSFWHKVKMTDTSSCWFWTGAVSSDGYGRITWTHNGRSRTMGTHRFALTLAHGSLPPGTVAAHACNNPLCVRVGKAHVHISSQSENLRYAVEHKRHYSNQVCVDSSKRRTRSLTHRATHTGLNPRSSPIQEGLF